METEKWIMFIMSVCPSVCQANAYSTWLWMVLVTAVRTSAV